jgi:hypothetical protein
MATGRHSGQLRIKGPSVGKSINDGHPSHVVPTCVFRRTSEGRSCCRLPEQLTMEDFQVGESQRRSHADPRPATHLPRRVAHVGPTWRSCGSSEERVDSPNRYAKRGDLGDETGEHFGAHSGAELFPNGAG